MRAAPHVLWVRRRIQMMVRDRDERAMQCNTMKVGPKIGRISIPRLGSRLVNIMLIGSTFFTSQLWFVALLVMIRGRSFSYIRPTFLAKIEAKRQHHILSSHTSELPTSDDIR